MQATLDEWLKCQVAWMYLFPIFGSDDIMQQMPTEGRAFKAVDATWRDVMKAALSVSSALQILSSEENYPKLLKANEALDQIQKGLNEYLETKRLAFPRFFFLSNDEMLAILSETKDPLRVQPYLKKVFEAIHRLEFQTDLKVTAMLSEEKERVPLTKVRPSIQARGDCWADIRESRQGTKRLWLLMRFCRHPDANPNPNSRTTGGGHAGGGRAGGALADRGGGGDAALRARVRGAGGGLVHVCLARRSRGMDRAVARPDGARRVAGVFDVRCSHARARVSERAHRTVRV